MRALKIFLVLLIASALIGFLGYRAAVLADDTDPPHLTHISADRGPNLGTDCGACHTASPETYANASQDTCYACHSEGGVYKGVTDGTIGALINWENTESATGANESLVYNTDGTLKSGKAKWCGGCHDEDFTSAVDLIDDFEGYADDSALQAVWQNGWDAGLPTVGTSGAPEGTQFMVVNVAPGNHGETRGYVRIFFPSPLDVSDVDSLRFSIKVDNTAAFAGTRVKVKNGPMWCDADVLNSGLQNGVWTDISLPRTSFTCNNWSNVVQIGFLFVNTSATTNVSIDNVGFFSGAVSPKAPNVIGDDETFGFYKSGHGTFVNCTWCHDSTKDHITVAPRVPVLDYIRDVTNPTGFRFYDDPTMGMQLPYNNYVGGTTGAFALCYTCHDEACITQNDIEANLDTNFRDAGAIFAGPENLHLYHVGAPGSPLIPVVYHGTCVLCHDPMAPRNPAMTRREMGNLVNFDIDGCELPEEDWKDEVLNVGGAQTLGITTVPPEVPNVLGFEGYADDSALQAKWKTGWDAGLATLGTSDPPQGTQYMVVNVDPANSVNASGYVIIYFSSINLSHVGALNFWIKVDDTAAFSKTVVKFGYNGAWCNADVLNSELLGDGVWTPISVSRSSFSCSTWTSVTQIAFLFDSTSAITDVSIDDIKFTSPTSSYPCVVCHNAAVPPNPDCQGTNPYVDPLGMDGWYTRAFQNDPCVLAVGVSHNTHLNNPKGPNLGQDDCNVCHATSFDLDTMVMDGVCDNCHSPDGAFDGVSDSVIGAGVQANWDDGVYESDGKTLKSGLKNWCLGCHDDDPTTTGTNESAITDGVYAPNIAGDENNGDTYGYNITGHKICCSDCHDNSKNHIDGDARTYDAGVTDYTDSYRLRSIGGQPAMILPRPLYAPATLPISHPEDFALCFDCHNPLDVLTESWSAVGNTNFWNDDDTDQNSHNIHLGINTNHFDSDFDGTADSSESCIACHIVHGPPNEAMIRHGELISTPGTTDKVPALNFAYTVPATPPWDTATWTPNITTAGNYYVYARWSPFTNRATNARYTVNYNGGSATHLVNQQINGNQWNMLGSVQYSFAVGTSGNVVLSIEGADGQVIADAVGFDSDDIFGVDPEIVIDNPSATFVGTWLFATGQGYGGSVHYHNKPAPTPDPSATLAQSVGGRMSYAGPFISQNGVCQACHDAISYDRTPKLNPKVINAKATPDTVANDGTGTTLITASVYDPDGDFDNTLPSKIEVDLSAISGSATQAMNDSGNNGDVTAGDGVYSYLATVAASTPDIPTEVVITATDDAATTGEGQTLLFVVEPGAIYIDDPDAEFFETWLSASGQGYGGSVHYKDAGTGSATATWRPDIPSAGNYKVYAWWSQFSNRATDAPYTINYDGGSQTIDVNQKINGGQWNQLGGTFPFIAGTSGTVVLTDDANGQVIADGIKFEPVP